MSDRLRYLCDKDLRDDEVSELQELALRKLQDVRMKDKRIAELKDELVQLRMLVLSRSLGKRMTDERLAEIEAGLDSVDLEMYPELPELLQALKAERKAVETGMRVHDKQADRIKELEAIVRGLSNAHHDEIEARTKHTALKALLEQWAVFWGDGKADIQMQDLYTDTLAALEEGDD